jgi:hypothetical protein
MRKTKLLSHRVSCPFFVGGWNKQRGASPNPNNNPNVMKISNSPRKNASASLQRCHIELDGGVACEKS